MYDRTSCGAETSRRKLHKIRGPHEAGGIRCGGDAGIQDALDGADKAEISRHKKRMLDMFDRGGGCTGYFYGDNAHNGCIAVSAGAYTHLRAHETDAYIGSRLRREKKKS